MARKRQAGNGNTRGKGQDGWHLLPPDGTPPEAADAGSPDAPAGGVIDMAAINEAIKSNPELLQEAFAAISQFHDEFVAEHGREPTEQDLIEHLGLGDDLDDAALDDMLADVSDPDLAAFLAEVGTDEDEDLDDLDEDLDDLDDEDEEDEDDSPPER